jgi:Family of unknown function (DUF6186)
MTRTITNAGYAVLATALALYQVAGLLWRRTPTLGEALAAVTGRPSVRWLLLAGWLWLGAHLFVRTGWG